MSHTVPVRFGTMSLVLAFGALQGIVVMLLLLRSKRNMQANRFLAGLLGITVLRLLPYVAGYAGVYDAYPWLSFAPWNLSLAFGPLVYLYIVRLSEERMPAHWRRHLLPAALQFLYYVVLFAQPLPFKNWWNTSVQRPWIAAPEFWWTLASAALYVVLASKRLRHYQRQLQNGVSYADDLRMTWVWNFLVASWLMFCAWFVFGVVDLVHGLSYFAQFPLYVGFAIFVYYPGA